MSDAAKPESIRVGSHLFVISGCSGSGKSTLIDALAEAGEQVVREPGRDIVKRELEAGRDGVPWLNVQRFVDLCAEQTLRDFDAHASSRRRTFFDRSFVDVATGIRRGGLAEPEGLSHAVATRRYAPFVFISAPWQELFHPDAERRHGFDEAVAEYEALVPAYEALGYEIVFIPRAILAERVAFVQEIAAQKS